MAGASIERRHAEWLGLVETSGPFLTVPVLKRALPDGLEGVDHVLPRLRLAHAEWRADPRLRARWIRWVLDDVLELRGRIRAPADGDPEHRVAEHRVTLRPDYVLPGLLLVHVADDAPGDAWAASPVDRAAELARAAEIPLALVTDGDRWTLVWSRQSEPTGTCTWRSELWLEEPVTLQAFTTLLGARRFFALPEDEGLEALRARAPSASRR